MTSKYFSIILLMVEVVIAVQSAPSERYDRKNIDAAPSEIFEDEYEDDSNQDVESRKLVDNGRRKRWYDMWQYQIHNGQLSGFNSFNRWKPETYQISRPYVIPVFGSDSSQYVYFPPQPIDYYPRQKPFNPGMPPDNRRPYKGQPYLPPVGTSKNNVTFDDRFSLGDFSNVDDQDEAERPVWGDMGKATSRRPMTSRTEAPPPRAPSNENKPTRPPLPPGGNEVPPLVHDIRKPEAGGTNHLSADYPTFEIPPQSLNNIKPTTRRPQMTSTTTTIKPGATPAGPGNCVWAVVSCCSASSSVVPENCFEQRGCPGPFWDRSPCDSDFAKSAIEKALEYYNQGRRRQ